MKNRIQELAKKNKDAIIGIRRHIHAHPELSFKEYNTSSYIKKILDDIGVSWTGNWAKTGIVATIEGNGSSDRVIMVRADIDALPITEANDSDYKSKNQGVMHACGHDAHTAGVLGAIIILNELKEHLKATIKFIFQPGEEKLPGGASILIKEGVLTNPKPDMIIAMHVHPPLEVGKIGIKSGQYMASADEINLDIIGKGGHAALPDNCINPLTIAAHILIDLQKFVDLNSGNDIPTVLSFGDIHAIDGSFNVIPDMVSISGTLRTLNETWRNELHESISNIAKDTASRFGAQCKVEIIKGYPSLFNDEAITNRLKSLATSYLGTENIVDLPTRMTAEDFAYYTKEIPGCLFRLGTGNTSLGITAPVHNAHFDIDENALEIASGYLAWICMNEGYTK